MVEGIGLPVALYFYSMPYKTVCHIRSDLNCYSSFTVTVVASALGL